MYIFFEFCVNLHLKELVWYTCYKICINIICFDKDSLEEDWLIMLSMMLGKMPRGKLPGKKLPAKKLPMRKIAS